MAQRGQRKLPETERRIVAKRYHDWRRNMPKRICAEHGINRQTLRAYVREFTGQG